MISIEVKDFDKSMKELKKLMDEGLRELIRNYISTFVGLLANQNPVGDDVTFRNWYLFREKYYGSKNIKMLPKAGLSKSNWRVALSDSSYAFIQDYSANESKIEASAYNKLENYRLGQSVYIVNNVPYVYEIDSNTVGVGRSEDKIDISTAYQISFAEFTRGLGKLQSRLNSL